MKGQIKMGKHLIEAASQLNSDFITLEDDNKVTFTVQQGPIGEVGVNGLQAVDIVEFCVELFKSLNNAVPCRENALTITKLEEGVLWQQARTMNRSKRGVEGTSRH